MRAGGLTSEGEGGEGGGRVQRSFVSDLYRRNLSRSQEVRVSSSANESRPRILLQGSLVFAIVHCLMESGVNKFDDLSGASGPAKFHRKTLIDSTPCTEQNVNVRSKCSNLQGYLEICKTKCKAIATLIDLPHTSPADADPEVCHTQRRKASAFVTAT